MQQIASLVGYDSKIDTLVASSKWCANPDPYTFIKIASFNKPLPGLFIKGNKDKRKQKQGNEQNRKSKN